MILTANFDEAYQSLDIHVSGCHVFNGFLRLLDILFRLNVVVRSSEADDVGVSSWSGPIADCICEFVEWIRDPCPRSHISVRDLCMDLHALIHMAPIGSRHALRVERRVEGDGVQNVKWDGGNHA